MQKNKKIFRKTKKSALYLVLAMAKGGQWLPLDPPNPESVTIGDLLAKNLNGPRRFGCGTVRDWLIGMTVVLPDGRLVKNGGKVVQAVQHVEQRHVLGVQFHPESVGTKGGAAIFRAFLEM